MSIEKLIDKMIQEAIARGEFDDLEGKGKPLDLDSYFATPEDLRMGYSVLKSNKFVPEEVDWLREIGELREKNRFLYERIRKRPNDENAPRQRTCPCAYSRKK